MRVHHLAFRTGDPAALARFYERVLGLRPQARPLPSSAKGQPAAASVWLSMEGAVLMIEARQLGEPLCDRGSMELVAWQVDAQDRAAVRARLAAEGVPIEHETEHTTYFRDPDGRRVAVSTYPLPVPP